jgi:phage gpG-like protein
MPRATFVMKEDFKRWKDIEKQVSTKLKAKVGILGKTNARDGSLTNAEIGLKHEFGSFSEGIPRRSFLIDTFEEKKKDLSEKARRILLRFFKKAINYKEVYKRLGIAGEKLVVEAFETGGFGKWKELSPVTIAKKGSSVILVDTVQLKKSITSEVTSE